MFRRIAQLCLIYLVAGLPSAAGHRAARPIVSLPPASQRPLWRRRARRPGGATGRSRAAQSWPALPGGSLIPELLPGGGAQPAAWLPEEVRAPQPVNVSVPSDPATARWGNFGQPAPRRRSCRGSTTRWWDRRAAGFSPTQRRNTAPW